MGEESLKLPTGALNAFCERWKVVRLDLFGSALGDDFTSESDVDLLVTFEDGVVYSLFDYVDMTEELEKAFGRSVDLVSRKAIEKSRNPFRKKEILGSAKPIYVKAA